MSATLKLITLSFCINIFLFLGVNYAVYGNLPEDQRPDMQDDLFTIFLDNRTGFKENIDDYVANLDSDTNYSTGYRFNPSGNFSNIPSSESGASIQVTEGGFAFLDVARMFLAFVTTIFRIAFMPLVLFQYNIFPPLVTLIVGVPLMALNVVTVIYALRGIGQ